MQKHPLVVAWNDDGACFHVQPMFCILSFMADGYVLWALSAKPIFGQLACVFMFAMFVLLVERVM
jgi:hypothetical protein